MLMEISPAKQVHEGNTTNFTYDANGRPLTSATVRTLVDGSTAELSIANVYNANDQLVGLTDPGGNTHEYDINGGGAIVGITDPDGNLMRINHTLTGRPEEIIFDDGGSVSYAYDKRGLETAAIDRVGRVTTQEYDEVGKLTKKSFPGGGSVSIDYDDGGRMTEATNTAGMTIHGVLDNAGKLTSFQNELGAAAYYDYASNGMIKSATDANGGVAAAEYDEIGRGLRATLPDGAELSTEYDKAGRKIAATDELGFVTRYGYDAIGNIIAVTDTLGGVTRFEYDEIGNNIAITDAEGKTTKFEYDNLRRLVKKILPLGMFETWNYDSMGNLLSHTDYNGDTIHYTYNKRRFLIAKDFPDGSTVEYTFTPTGKYETVTTREGTTRFEYDVSGPVVAITEAAGQSIRYGYNVAGKVTSITTAAGSTLYTYDEIGRLSAVQDPDGETTAYAYDQVGNVTAISYPNGVVASFSYDSMNRMTWVEHRKGAAPVLFAATYTYNLAGNRIRTEEHTGRTIDFTYDTRSRLIREAIHDSTIGDETIEYTYDAVGNRLTKTDTSGTVTYTYDDNHRLTGDGTYTYTYDNNGNLSSQVGASESSTYAYSAEGRILSATKTDGGGTDLIQYLYSPGTNARIRKTLNGSEITNYVVDPIRGFPQVVLETDGSGTPQVSYVYGKNIISQKRGTDQSFYHREGTPSIRCLTDNTGTVTDRYTYEAFGQELDTTGSTLNHYRFVGEQYDPDLGLYYLRARYLDPLTGRFVSRDAAQGIPTDPETYHPYVYVKNNPVMFIDPTGHLTMTEILVVAAIIAVMAGLNTALIHGGMHPLGFGNPRSRTEKYEESKDYWCGRWFQMSSSLNFNIAMLNASFQTTGSRSIGRVNVYRRDQEAIFAIDFGPFLEMGMRNIWVISRAIAGVATSMYVPDLDNRSTTERFVEALTVYMISNTTAYKEFFKKNYSIGLSWGWSVVGGAYSSDQIGGWAIGMYGGGSTPGTLAFPVMVGFDIAWDVGFNVPWWHEDEELFHGLYTFPNFSFSMAFGLGGGADFAFQIYLAEPIGSSKK